MKSYNPIISGYPSYIEIDGNRILIETGFRTWLQISRAMFDDDLPDNEKLTTLYVLSGIPLNMRTQEVTNALVEFLAADPKCNTKRSKKLFSWDYDAERIIASYQMQYGIDITSPDTIMHWWRFMALFRGLGDSTPIMQIISLRNTPLPTGNDENSKQRRKQIIQSQKAYELPPESEREHLERLKEQWSI